jgi:flagellar basal body-associated protein FliL
MIPSIKIFINSKPYLTDSISVEVANVAVDTLKQKMYDIKDIVPVKGSMVTGGNTLIMVLIIGIGIVVYWFVKDNKRKKLKKRFTKHQ